MLLQSAAYLLTSMAKKLSGYQSTPKVQCNTKGKWKQIPKIISVSTKIIITKNNKRLLEPAK